MLNKTSNFLLISIICVGFFLSLLSSKTNQQFDLTLSLLIIHIILFFVFKIPNLLIKKDMSQSRKDTYLFLKIVFIMPFTLLSIAVFSLPWDFKQQNEMQKRIEARKYSYNYTKGCYKPNDETHLGVDGLLYVTNKSLRKLVSRKSLCLDNSIYSGFSDDLINTSLVTDMSELFKNHRFTKDPKISKWNTSNVIAMREMFRGNTGFNYSINEWDISNVIDMSYMFADTIEFNQPLNKWNTSSLRRINYIFYRAEGFNQNINEWDTSQLTEVVGAFNNAIKFNQPLNKWDVSNITNFRRMFWNANSFNQNINNWNVSSANNFSGMFGYAQSFNQPLNQWDTRKVNTIEEMFKSAYFFDQPLNYWNTSNIKNTSQAFAHAFSFSYSLRDWDMSGVTDMRAMFWDTRSFNKDISNWDVRRVLYYEGFEEHSILDKQNNPFKKFK